MKNKVVFLLICIAVTVIVSVYIYMTQNSIVVPEGSPEYSHEINKWLEEKKTALGSRVPESDDNYWEEMVSLSDTRISNILLYGKVVDQDGLPVSSALVQFEAASGYLSEGTGLSSVRTNENGTFNTEGSRGRVLLVRDIIKQGYSFSPPSNQALDFENFKRFGDSLLWSNYSSDNPYVFTVWRIDEKANVKRDKLSGLTFDPDGSVYTLNFMAGRKGIKKKGVYDGDINISFFREGELWRATFSSINGGFVESSNQYMNMAPSSGYVKEIVYSGSSEQYELKRKLYFQSRSGGLYGKLDFRIIPKYRDRAGIHLEYVVNLDGKRSLFSESE